MGNIQLEYSPDELLADHPFAEPLRVGDVTCHGGFSDSGEYVSPRTRYRTPAIAAWQQHHRETFGGELLDIPLDTWPRNYPNLDQARFLLGEGVRDPIVASLTRIGTVEGFGAMIRHLAPGDMQPFFDEDLRGTATAHLGRGLVEAHARDEAGWGDQAGHNRMWFAVRDIAFENPVTGDQTATMLARMGIGGGYGGAGGEAGSAADRYLARRVFPDLDLGLEMLVSTMLRVLFIEIKAFHVFRWAETLLSDDSLVAGDGMAARIVSWIRADETPHVEYLRTSLSEMHARTFLGESGRRRPGREVIGTLWDRALEESTGVIEESNRRAIANEVELAVGRHPRGRDILERFHSLGDWRPAA